MCSNSYNFFVKSVGYGDYDGKNCGSKAGTGAGRFETDSRYVHQEHRVHPKYAGDLRAEPDRVQRMGHPARRSEAHTSELQSLMRLSYAVFCLKKKKKPDT